MANNIKIALLVGGGSRVPSMLECAQHTKGVDIVFVASLRRKSVGVEIAGRYGIESSVIKWTDYKKLDGGREKFSEEVLRMLKEREVDFVILAGWTVLMPQSFIDAFYEKAINIHPSILPSYPGNGVRAIHAQWEEELERRNASPLEPPGQAGCTLHYIDAGMDTGAHILQGFVNPRECKSEEELRGAIHKKEDEVLAVAIGLIAKGEI